MTRREELLPRLRASRQRDRRNPPKMKRFVHFFCGQEFQTLEEATLHSMIGNCQPCKATIRELAAKGFRFKKEQK